MNTQNILKYYGSKLDIKLDHSEFYDLELAGVNNDYDENLLKFTTGDTISYSSLLFDSDCVTGLLLPISFEIGEEYTYDDCNPFTIRRRSEKGWTIDVVVNKNGQNWTNGKNIFYMGIDSDSETTHYLDNNLTFSFTTDGKIKWQSYRYSGYCDTVSGYTETSYISSGQTSQLFDEPYNSNTDLIFNVSITFERYSEYVSCDLSNEGGWNDLITGITINNPANVITGATGSTSYNEVLNEKWFNERIKRLGKLSIFINGKRIYKIDNWEEIIPSPRDFENFMEISFGGGVAGSGGIHYFDNTSFDFERIRYYEEPLNPFRINHNYLTTIKPYYNITNTTVICDDELTGYTDVGLLTEDQDNLLTEDNNILIY